VSADVWDRRLRSTFTYRGQTMDFIAPLDESPDAADVIAYLLAALEKERAGLSRALHDEMGGLLVAAAMDVGFAEQALSKDDRLRQQLARARTALSAAIDLKRKLIESLRPSMLDNFGLFEAIRWEVKQESGRTGLPCSDSYPDPEPRFTPDAAIALFRIAQQSLGVALRQPSVKAARIALEIEGDTLRIGVFHDGDSQQAVHSDDALAICSIAHRAHRLGGRLVLGATASGGAHYVASLPLARLIST
jgi:signal transduction histidine kinase